MRWATATDQLRRLSGRPDLTPGIDLVMTIVTLGLRRHWAHVRNADAIDQLLRERGEPSRIKATTLLLTAGALGLCALCEAGTLYKLQEALNRAAGTE